MSRPTVEALIRPLAMPTALAAGYCSFPQRLAACSARRQTSHQGGHGRGWPGAPVSFGIVLGLALTLVWSVTGAHYFWPGWIWFTLALPVAFYRSIRWALHTPGRRSLALHAAISLVIAATLVAIWVLSSHRYFWPIWPILVLVVVLAGHTLFGPSASSSREQALAERGRRLDSYPKRRPGRPGRGDASGRTGPARRAQARLVSLGMNLGMADELLDSDPEEAHRLLAEAHRCR